MKINSIAAASVVSLFFSFNGLSVYGKSVVTANDVNSVNLENISVISSQNGEAISRMESLENTFQIASSNEDYITTKFCKVISKNPIDINVPIYEDPSKDSDQVGQIYVGATVAVSKSISGFSEILFEGELVYIDDSYLVDSKPLELVSNQEEAKKENIVQDNSKYTSKIEDNDKITKYDLKFVNKEDKLKEDHNNQKPTIQQSSNALNSKVQDIIKFAKLHLGKPYVYGSSNLNVGTDCSGFTHSVFKNFGIKINRSSRDQYLNGTSVNRSNLLPGDLVFFNKGGSSPISHVGLYIGNNEYIHSTDGKVRGIVISSLSSPYSLRTYYGAKRIIN